MSTVELINEIKNLRNALKGKFELTRGVRIWGEDEAGEIRLVRVDEDGQLITVNP